MTSRSEIVWSPTFRDQFLVVDSDMTLYKLDRYAVGDLHPTTTSTLTHWVSNNSTATRLCTNRDLQHHRCFDWHPRSNDYGHDLVAVGYANGRVLLTSPSVSMSALSQTNVDAIGADSSTIAAANSTPATATATATANSNSNSKSHYDHQHDEIGTVGGIRVLGKEFVPKHSRPCQSVRWNAQHTQWLAIGLDRHRSDNGIFIWDIFSRSASSVLPSSYESISNAVTSHHHNPLSTSVSQHQYDLQQNSIVVDHRRAHSGMAASLDVGAPLSAIGGPSQQQHTRALHEFAGGESAHSLVWLSQSPRSLACGLSGKCIRLYDTRELSRFQMQIATKAVYGLTVDPFSDQRLCSFVDNQLFLWDLRHTEKPLLVIADQKPFAKIQWDPCRRNVFTSLCKDSAIVKVYHLQQIIAEETELSYTENHVQAPFIFSDESLVNGNSSSLSTVVSYDWHPQEECHLLCLNACGTISDFWVNERLCVGWSPDGGRLLTAFGKLIAELKHFHLTGDETTPVGDKDDELQQDEDASVVMQRRALLGYGIIGDSGASDDSRSLKQNADLCAADGGTTATTLVWAWTWMDKLKQMGECEPADLWPYDTGFPGVMHVLRMASGAKPSLNSNIEYRSMAGLDAAAGHTAMFRVYTSPERDRVLQFCGWGSVHAQSRDRSFSIGGGDAFFQDLVDGRQAERAAAVALFTLRLRVAAQILTKAASLSDDKNHLQMIALALAGYPGAPSDREQGGGGTPVGVVSTPTQLGLSNSSSSAQTSAVTSIISPTSLWVDQCNAILPKLTNPYLKAMFQFLACRATGGNNFESLLELGDFPLHDKVAFAAMFATDQRLEELVESLTRQCVARGDLYGLLLTGLGSEQSINLVQRYIDTTSDVQTGALLIIYGGGGGANGDAVPSSAASTMSTSTTTTSGLRDNNTISRIVDGYFSLLDAWGLWHVRAQTNALYLKRCQNLVGKITPQVYITCTYCSRSIWAGAGGRMRQRMHKLGSCPSCKKPLPRCALCRLNVGVPLSFGEDLSRPNKFASWFAWCQSCRHGGHAQHLSDWFTMNNECPVTGCSCKCAALDASSDFSQLLLTLMKNDP